MTTPFSSIDFLEPLRAAQSFLKQSRENPYLTVRSCAPSGLEDEYMDIVFNGLEELGRTKGGLVYVVASESFKGHYKVGFTRHSPNKRLSQLNRGSNLDRLSFVCAYPFIDANQAEQICHAQLKKYRVKGEFFKAPLEEILQVVKTQYLTLDRVLNRSDLAHWLTWLKLEVQLFLNTWAAAHPQFELNMKGFL